MNITEPYFERFSIYDSYACRLGKGLHLAIARARDYQRSHQWFLKLDVRKYFDSIDHCTLKALLARRFKDLRLLDIFARIIDSASVLPGNGLPIGNLTSQHFANFYLGHLDHFVFKKPEFDEQRLDFFDGVVRENVVAARRIF